MQASRMRGPVHLVECAFLLSRIVPDIVGAQ